MPKIILTPFPPTFSASVRQAPWPTADELQSWEVIERHTSFCFGLINGQAGTYQLGR